MVGGGPAGIAAATRAAQAGASVLLLDEGLRPGGQIWRHTTRDRLPRVARRWLAQLDGSGARVLTGATVTDLTPGCRVIAETREGVLRVDADKLILATGARECFLPFPGWTLPNVLGVGGAQALLKSGASFRGKRVIVAGSGPLLLPVAAALARSGARIALVAEQAAGVAVRAFAWGLWRSPGRLVQAAQYRFGFFGARYRTGTWVMRADGDAQVRGATLTDGRRTWSEPCDVLCVGYGLVPSTELARLAGCASSGGRVQVDEQQRTRVPAVWCAGEPTGIGGMDAALLEGEVAGLSAAGRVTRQLEAEVARQWRFAGAIDHAFALRPELRQLAEPGTIVCRCEDVTLETLAGTSSARQAKLYTRAGMGPCQGRVCGAALEFLYGWDSDTVRVPVSPARVSTFLEPTMSAAAAEGDV